MIIANVIILIILISLYIITFRQTHHEWIRNINKKEHKLYFLYPMATWILDKTKVEIIMKENSKVEKSIKALYVTSKPEGLKKTFWCDRISLVIIIIFIFNMISLYGQIQSMENSALIEDKYLKRPTYGAGSKEVELSLTMKNIEKDSKNGNEALEEERIKIKVEEQAYPKAALKKAFQEAVKYLDISVLGQNESADFIYEDLNFTKVIPGTSITVEWQPEDYNLIQLDGTVQNETIKPEGVTTGVTAILKYRKDNLNHKMNFRIMPRKVSSKDKLMLQLEQEIASSSERTKESEKLELPTSLGKYKLSWNEKSSGNGIVLLLLGIMAAVIAWVYSEKELEQQMKKRRNQMLLDYPEIINKFTLLINAGMTVKQAWLKIAEDYDNKTYRKNVIRHYAYEEMIATVWELNLGIPEQNAYEQFGRRVGLMPYMKFSSLIAQNLKKGNKGLIELLSKEALEAFEERKEMAKRLGEEAGTKLLAPMMVMLIIVFLVILIPAFKAFGT